MRSQIEGVTKDWPTFPQSKALPTKRYNKVRQIHFTTRRTLFLLITKATHYFANKNHYSTSPFLHLPRLLNQTNNARSNNIPSASPKTIIFCSLSPTSRVKATPTVYSLLVSPEIESQEAP